MNRPDLANVQHEVADYITSLETLLIQDQLTINQQNEQLKKMDIRIADLEQMLQNLQRMYFGKKSEKIHTPLENAEQLSFLPAEEEAEALPTDTETEKIEVSSFSRKKKRTQEEIIASLPVVVHECKLAEEDLQCPRCGSENMECIGKELVYTEYERVPAHVIRHDFYANKYACRNCEDGTGRCESCEFGGTEQCNTCPDRPRTVVIIAQLPKEVRNPLIKGSKASPSIMAQIYDDKFEQGIPLNRQEKEWERLGFPLSRQTMTNWALRIDRDYFQTVVAYMLKTARDQSKVLHCDETPIKVIQQKTASGKLKKCQMWVIRTGKYEKIPIVVFNYRSSRAANELDDILEGYREYFVADGYSGYNHLGRQATRCGCWAHLRRKFYDSVPDHNMSLPGTARDGVQYCDKLFRIEEKLEKVDTEERKRVRNTESRQVIDEFYTWLENVQETHKNLHEAVTFARNQKEYLLRFLEDPLIPITNAAAENAIRPFVVGRKGWLFSCSEDGATATADAYSIAETAKANNLDVMKYFNFILRRLPMADGNLTDDFIETLMPWNAEAQECCQRGYI